MSIPFSTCCVVGFVYMLCNIPIYAHHQHIFSYDASPRTKLVELEVWLQNASSSNQLVHTSLLFYVWYIYLFYGQSYSSLSEYCLVAWPQNKGSSNSCAFVSSSLGTSKYGNSLLARYT